MPFEPVQTRNISRRLNMKTHSKTPNKRVKAVHIEEYGRFNEDLSQFQQSRQNNDPDTQSKVSSALSICSHLRASHEFRKPQKNRLSSAKSLSSSVIAERLANKKTRKATDTASQITSTVSRSQATKRAILERMD